MKKIILFFLLVAPLAFSQNKYLIYFKDKGISPTNALSKSDALYKEALSQLSAKAIERREKVMPANQIITYEDIPIKKDYITQLENIGIKIENRLNWFNAVSAYLTDSQINKINMLPFVKKINPVRILKYNPEKIEVKQQLNKIESYPSQADYGLAYGQLKLSDVPIVHSKELTDKV